MRTVGRVRFARLLVALAKPRIISKNRERFLCRTLLVVFDVVACVCDAACSSGLALKDVRPSRGSSVSLLGLLFVSSSVRFVALGVLVE